MKTWCFMIIRISDTLFQAPNSMICYSDVLYCFISHFSHSKNRHVSGPFSRTMTIRNQVGHLSRADIQHLQPEVRLVRYVRLRRLDWLDQPSPRVFFIGDRIYRIYMDFMTIYDDIWWYMMIYDDIFCYRMIYDDIWWYMMIHDDTWWYTMIYDDIWWYMMIHDDIHDDIYDDIWWYMMKYDHIWWYMMIYDDIWWYMMKYDEIWWYMMIYDDIWW